MLQNDVPKRETIMAKERPNVSMKFKDTKYDEYLFMIDDTVRVCTICRYES